MTKCVPQNSPTMHFNKALDPVSRGTSKWPIDYFHKRRTIYYSFFVLLMLSRSTGLILVLHFNVAKRRLFSIETEEYFICLPFIKYVQYE